MLKKLGLKSKNVVSIFNMHLHGDTYITVVVLQRMTICIQNRITNIFLIEIWYQIPIYRIWLGCCSIILHIFLVGNPFPY